MCPAFPALLPLPLLTLKLSTSTMLDTILLDAGNATPLFSIETDGNQTGLYRAVAASNGQSLSRVASIHWPVTNRKHPKKEKDAVVFVDGQVMPSSTFLKNTLLGASRKFHIPGQSNALKWKHVGAHWECTLCAAACTSHRAVATFEPAHTTSAARLAIYTEGVVSSRNRSVHEQYRGVDMDMLLYLVLSSLLLTTSSHAWQTVHKQLPSPVQQQEKQSHSWGHRLHVLPPMITTSSPSPSSSRSPRIDLLGDDDLASAHSPLRGSPTSIASSGFSGFSSLPPSPLTPSMDLSSIHHDTFSSSSNSNCPVSSTSVFRRNSNRSNRMPSPLITCSTFSNSSCSSSSPTTSAAPSTPITSIPAGPHSITPYHLPPAPSHTPTTPSTPVHSLHPHHHAPSSFHSHSHHQQHPHRSQTSSNNALHLDTSHTAPIPYTTQMYHLQFATDPVVEPAISNDELPPAYNEIEWTVRVKQPRQGQGSQLRVHVL